MRIPLELIRSAGQAIQNASISIPKAWQEFKRNPESPMTGVVAAFLALPAYYTLKSSMPPLIKLTILAPMAFVVGAAGLMEYISSKRV